MNDSHPARAWPHKALAYYVVIMLLLFLLPVPAIPLVEAKHVDKLLHFLIYLGFVLLYQVERQGALWEAFLVGVAFAGVIELVQSILPYREGDWKDFLAGASGAGLGVVLVLVRKRLMDNQ